MNPSSEQPPQMVGIIHTGPNGEEGSPRMVPISMIENIIAQGLSQLSVNGQLEEISQEYRSLGGRVAMDGQSVIHHGLLIPDEDPPTRHLTPIPTLQSVAPDRSAREDEEAKEDSLEDDNHYEKPGTSLTKDMTGEALLDSICKMAINLFAKDDPEYTGFGPVVNYASTPEAKSITVTNIIFEVNQVTCVGIKISQLCPGPPDLLSYVASVHYKCGDENGWNIPKFYVVQKGATLKDAVSGVYTGLKKMKRCPHCTMIYDTAVSDHCAICLFSDYFTKENPLVTCVICTEQTRDFTTLKCYHRFCAPCLFKLPTRKCPTCRAMFSL